MTVAERDWLTLIASPLGVTPSITLTAPSGIVTRTVIGMAPGRSDSTSATFSGRTETVTAVPRQRCADLASLISGPASTIQKMAEVLNKMADDPEIIAAMRKLGASTVKSTPEQFRTQIGQEIEQWKPLIAEIQAKENK